MSLSSEFKAFVLRGNVVDLAVGVVIGAAFGNVVTALVADILTPLISIPGSITIGEYDVKIGGGTFRVGHFLNVLMSFLLIALAVFFFVVKPVNLLLAKRKAAEPPPRRQCPFCRSDIADLATRCPFCTSELPVAPEKLPAG